MKKIIYLLFCFLILFEQGCNKAQSKQNELNKINSMEEQPIYSLKITSGNPYETYINDMLLEKDYLSGANDNELIINDLILKSGKQKLRLVLLPNKGESFVDKLGVDYVKLSIYKYKNGYIDYEKRKSVLLCEFTLNNFQEKLPKISEEWIFEIKVPYSLNGWSQGVDLTKENTDELYKEVVDFYNKLGRVIDKGDKEAFYKIMEDRDKEVFASLYNDDELIKNDKIYMENRLSKSIGNIQPIKDSHLYFYGEGKVIALENRNGETPLFGEDKDNIYSYQIYLYRPSIGAGLEVIR